MLLVWLKLVRNADLDNPIRTVLAVQVTHFLIAVRLSDDELSKSDNFMRFDMLVREGALQNFVRSCDRF